MGIGTLEIVVINGGRKAGFFGKAFYFKGRNLEFIFNGEMNVREIRKLSSITPKLDKAIDMGDFNIVNHTLSFSLPARCFKKIVGDVDSCADMVDIQQVGQTGPLTFIHTSSDDLINAHHIFEKSEDIKFMSKVCGDSIFSSTININSLKPVAAALCLDKDTVIDIHVDESKKAVFSCSIDDDAVEVKIATPIVKHRGPNTA